VRDRGLEEHRRRAARITGAHAVGLGDKPLEGRDRRSAAHLDVPAQAFDVGRQQRVGGQAGGLVEQPDRALGKRAADGVARRGQ
jgi:hypothetical protein